MDKYQCKIKNLNTYRGNMYSEGEIGVIFGGFNTTNLRKSDLVFVGMTDMDRFNMVLYNRDLETISFHTYQREGQTIQPEKSAVLRFKGKSLSSDNLEQQSSLRDIIFDYIPSIKDSNIFHQDEFTTLDKKSKLFLKRDTLEKILSLKIIDEVNKNGEESKLALLKQ